MFRDPLMADRSQICKVSGSAPERDEFDGDACDHKTNDNPTHIPGFASIMNV